MKENKLNKLASIKNKELFSKAKFSQPIVSWLIKKDVTTAVPVQQIKPNRTKFQSNSIEHNRTQSVDWVRLSSAIEPNRTHNKKNMGNRTQSNVRFPNSWFFFFKKLVFELLKSITGFWRLELLQYKRVSVFCM